MIQAQLIGDPVVLKHLRKKDTNQGGRHFINIYIELSQITSM